MKTTKFIIAFLLVLFFAFSVYAQQEENQLIYCQKHTVKPEKIDEYKELMKKFASACKEYNYPFAYSAWQSTHPDFYYIWPVKDYNEPKEVMNKAWGDVIPNMEHDWGAKFSETVESWDDFFIKSIDSLSYNPENSVGDFAYAEWWIRYQKTWTGWTHRNTFKQTIKMIKESNAEYPIFRFQGDIGMNGPAIITLFWGKNRADLASHRRENWESLGDEGQNMINDLSSITRKIETIPFWRLKELSYSPE